MRYPAAFLAGLLRNQPMGFYSPQSLVADARRHGVTVLPPDIARSGARAGLEPCVPIGTDRHRYDDGLAVRLGLDEVKGIGAELAARIVAERATAPYADLRDLSRRAALTTAQPGGAGDGRRLRRLRAGPAPGDLDGGVRRARRPAPRQHSRTGPTRACPG
ncbi:hypothetical protein [Nocardioides convexus]|uniref:helix-hairpin-helix domain-containing protein n=1 Tax=Nocardioides convexus TaxID=2712224 RepID=UPI00310121CE